jgi:hypothetical protein
LALSRGQQPSALLLDQLRYLRQLGVPFSKEELGGGRGNRIRYGFDHLIELGVALFGLQGGMAPREVVRILVEHRVEPSPRGIRAARSEHCSRSPAW